jgi:regulator of RNase E activity RraB
MKQALLALVVLMGSAAVAEAQVKNRWRLQWSNDKPQIYTYRTPNDHYENFWFFTYTLENTTDEIIPLIADVLLYTETGKELQNDFRKIDSAVIKEEADSPKKAEALKYGRFYANVIDPEAEYKIIEYHARLGNRSDGIIRESIEAFKKGFATDPPEEFKGRWKKGDRLYLNPREMREQRFIQPGQKIHGIAIFKNVDPRAHVYEIHVSGLVDIVKITAVTEDEWKLEYEPQTLKIRYERQGDAFEIERDMLYRMTRKEYVVKKIGPIASKDTIDKLVNGLIDTLKKELEWREKDTKGAELDKLRAANGIEPLDTRIMAMVFKLATDKDFGYDPSKDVLGNEKVVWRIHEWWITNRSKLVFNEITNRYEIKDDPLPGTVPEK